MLGKNLENQPDKENVPNDISSQEKRFTGKHIKKKPLIAVALTLVGILLFSLFKPETSSKKKKENTPPPPKEKIHVTDTVGDLPSTYKELKKREVPLVVKDIEVENSQLPEPTSTLKASSVPQTTSKQLTQEQQELLRRQKQEADQAKRSNIGFRNFENKNSTVVVPADQTSSVGMDYDSNRQGSKKNFLKNETAEPFYLSSVKSKPLSEYLVQSGNIIPGVLITGINSDLPGSIVGQVRENVFDSLTGNYLLIPQGTRMIGTYDSNVTWGQDRVLIVWQRLLFPNGESINLENMPGVDLSGYAGFSDKVNNHFGTLLKGVLLSSVMGATSAVVTGNNGNDSSWGAEAGKGAGQVIVELGDKFAQKALERQPTIEIRQGYRFNILVHRDMILSPYSNR